MPAIAAFRNATSLLGVAIDTECMNVKSQTELDNLSSERKTAFTTVGSLMIPHAVLLAFTAELILKGCLHGLSICPPKVHSLAKLYKKLPEKRRDLIQVEVNDVRFMQKLETCSATFVEWRYFFDGNSKPCDTDFLSILCDALMNEFSHEL